MESIRHVGKSVCAVIVNYNGGATLTECVRSLRASTIPVSIVVSDNGSEDYSIAYLRASVTNAPQLSIIENGENLGYAKANNIALARCRSDYVLVLNPDCIVKPDTLEKMIGVMERHPEAGMAGCLIVNPDGSEQVGCRRLVPTPWRSMVRVLHLHQIIRNHPRFRSFMMAGLPLPRAPEPVEAISGAFMLVRREALAAVGLMDGNYFLHCEDLDWCMRFRQAGWKILFAPHVRIVHWKGLSSMARPVVCEYHKHRGMVRFYNKFFRQQYPDALMVMVVTAVWLRFVAKTGWLWLRTLFTARHAARPAVVSAAVEHDYERVARESLIANRDS
jgi:GT2 family glycosyltransferase